MIKAKIYQPSKTAMQSGRGKAVCWVLEYETSTARRPEGLMGWTQSGDTLNQVKIKFETKEEALAFAQKNDIDASVQTPNARKVKARNYGDNFKYIPQDGKSA